MRPACLITNFNYGHFLGQCLDSLVGQIHPFYKIILVDDGSSDNSIEVASKYKDRLPLTIVQKPNGGQLSCFHASMSAFAADDLVFFLDADDFYPSHYVSTLMGFACSRPPVFLFCAPHVVAADATTMDFLPAFPPTLESIPVSRALTLGCRLYVGSPTSGLCIPYGLLRDILPYPDEEDWRTCADNVLVFGSSVLGAEKVFVRGLRFAYRQHGKNVYMGRTVSAGERSLHRARIDRLITHFAQQAGVRRWPALRDAFSEIDGLPAGWPNDHFVTSRSRYVAYRLQFIARKLIAIGQSRA